MIRDGRTDTSAGREHKLLCNKTEGRHIRTRHLSHWTGTGQWEIVGNLPVVVREPTSFATTGREGSLDGLNKEKKHSLICGTQRNHREALILPLLSMGTCRGQGPVKEVHH